MRIDLEELKRLEGEVTLDACVAAKKALPVLLATVEAADRLARRLEEVGAEANVYDPACPCKYCREFTNALAAYRAARGEEGE